MSFLAFASSYGLTIRDLRDDGRIHRCPTEDKPRSDNGAYMLDRDRGWCMNWATGDRVQWWNDENAKPWTEEEKAEARAKHMRQRQERLERAKAAAQSAEAWMGEAELLIPQAAQAWRPGRPAKDEVKAHPYLVVKGFPQEAGFVRDGELLIPMFDHQAYGKLIGLQRISADGSKKFLTGQRSKGAVHRFGNGKAPETWLCEGYATGLSVRAALRALYRTADVVVCFSAGNMVHVSQTIGTHIMADNDVSRAGEDAAIQSGLPYSMPAEVGFDANDVHQKHGLGAVVELVQRRT